MAARFLPDVDCVSAAIAGRGACATKDASAVVAAEAAMAALLQARVAFCDSSVLRYRHACMMPPLHNRNHYIRHFVLITSLLILYIGATVDIVSFCIASQSISYTSRHCVRTWDPHTPWHACMVTLSNAKGHVFVRKRFKARHA